MSDIPEPTSQVLLCSNCFVDEGLRLDAEKHGLEQQDKCPNCQSTDGRKLTRDHITSLSWRFFVSGTTVRCEYGAAPSIQLNENYSGQSDITSSAQLEKDIKLVEKAASISFFHYGPPLWMVGDIEPLKALQDPATRPQTIERVLREFREKTLSKGSKFYRLRVKPERPNEPSEYDSPPIRFVGKGRLDSPGFPVMYGSQDIDVCIHECRAATEDDLYVATLKTQKNLRLLDLAHPLEETETAFESLDMAIHMLFLARSHSYDIARDIALAAREAGFDGIIYPSFFSLIRTGTHPFETIYGLPLRHHHPNKEQYVEATTILNLALFGWPIDNGLVTVECINRLILTKVQYRGHFGPIHL
ncbi:RES family NAD+ phosphorylase [Alcaligenes parafaecalis]|uniref:RES family NAD+ phosphorylase n=1 Tax=Alcaligenes parafaecalis TaxID=171260 RepID=A0ABT3VIX3_9BURK|nr:RES family NAD+ phosphorylase [Alcaligenes parafaecalis]MCX5463145.1 RES family NAD+ phosphorylase [Alcaligenes parafaecalis]